MKHIKCDVIGCGKEMNETSAYILSFGDKYGTVETRDICASCWAEIKEAYFINGTDKEATEKLQDMIAENWRLKREIETLKENENVTV